MPELKDIIVEQQMESTKKIDWAKVKPIFHSYSSPLRSIRFEQSPPNIIRARDIERDFQD